jgi:hypothetical protein
MPGEWVEQFFFTAIRRMIAHWIKRLRPGSCLLESPPASPTETVGDAGFGHIRNGRHRV